MQKRLQCLQRLPELANSHSMGASIGESITEREQSAKLLKGVGRGERGGASGLNSLFKRP
jgi:hypothetical protein